MVKSKNEKTRLRVGALEAGVVISKLVSSSIANPTRCNQSNLKKCCFIAV